MTDLELAKQRLSVDGLAFVFAKAGVVLSTGRGPGIRDLMAAVRALGDQAHDACLADKIIGKAAAMVAILAGIRAAYTPLVSQAAYDTLARYHISLEYDRLVPLILNGRGDGPCPMERVTLPIDDPEQAVAALAAFVDRRPSNP